MNSPKAFFKNLSLLRVSFFLVGLVSSPLMAAELTISAEFRPDPSSPTKNEFKNTTPVTGLCFRYSQLCESQGIFSIVTGLAFVPQTPIKANHSDPRDGAYFKLPSNFVDIQVMSSTGATKTVKLRLSGIGAEYILSLPVEDITGGKGHQQLWEGGSWTYAKPPCRYTGVNGGNSTIYGFFWIVPDSSVCSRKALFDIPGIRYREVQIGYTLVTPDPLEMESGTYTGRVQFTIGNNQDIDFGNSVKSIDTILALNLQLKVDHILTLQFPPGADRLVLVPDGGWQQWLQRGRRPEKLFANQSFQIWSSSTFKMILECQYPVANQCGIQNETGDLVPVQTRVTLPAGIMPLGDIAVNRHLLSSSKPSIFNPSQYVDNGRAILHFEVDRDSVAQMTKHAGTRYAGNVTIVWDSELDRL